MLNEATDSVYTVPNFDAIHDAEQDLSAYAIERAILPKYEQEGTLDLGHEEAPRPNYWNVPEQKHEAMPQSVIEEAGYQRPPDVAAQIANMSPEMKNYQNTQLTRTLAGVRRETLTLAA